MPKIFNIYCDETCHLENDGHHIMVIGALRCPVEGTRAIAEGIREIKSRHGIDPHFEIKFNRASRPRLDFYIDLIDYFFSQPALRLRCVVVNKQILNHEAWHQTHTTFYYKIVYLTIKRFLEPHSRHNVYLDQRDTHGGLRSQTLARILRNHETSRARQEIDRVQIVRSHEVEQMQLADLLIGCVGYANREGVGAVKSALVGVLQAKSRKTLKETTAASDRKISILHWVPRADVQ